MSMKSRLQVLRTGVSLFGLVCAFSSPYYPTPALAGAGTITVKDSTGTTQTFDIVTDGSGNFIQKSVLCDQAAAANCASVDASHNLGVIVGEALPGGTATIGNINAIITSLPGGTATLGAISSIINALPAGTNKVGTVDPATIATWGLAAVAPGTAPTNALVGGVIYNSVQPTLTTGQSVAFQSTSRGGLLVANDVGGFTVQVGNIVNWAGSALGAMSTYGTSPGAVLVPAVNAYVTNTNANGQATMGNSSPVVIASDQSAVAIKTPDPCGTKVQIPIPISQTGQQVKIFTGTTLVKNYICSLFLVDSNAESMSIVEGTTGGSCTSNTLAIIGGSAASLGPAFAANGGLAWSGGGYKIAAGTNAGFDVCIFKSGGGTLSGALNYVQS